MLYYIYVKEKKFAFLKINYKSFTLFPKKHIILEKVNFNCGVNIHAQAQQTGGDSHNLFWTGNTAYVFSAYFDSDYT